MNNFLSLLQNSQFSLKRFIFIKKTKKNILILNSLWSENLISGYLKKDFFLKIYLKYYRKKPIIQRFKTFNNYSKKYYFTLKQIWKIKANFSIPFFSTNKGIFSLSACKKRKIGG